LLGIKHRVVNAALLVASFSALSVDDPMASLLLLQSYARRGAGGAGGAYFETHVKPFRRLFKMYAVAIAVACVWTGNPGATSSRQSAGVALLSALVS
jgi:hypothetical protein